MTRAGHLVARFAGSLRPRRLDDAELDLVRSVLTPAELACWERLGRADRAESVATARALGPDAEPTWTAVALLHDVGKAETSFGPFRRAGATAIAIVVGSERVRSWANSIGRYVDHDELGSNRLREVGARPEAVAWAAAHHRPDRWPATGIPPEICARLAAADGEPERE
jgi:hypothetical protein